MRRPRLVREVFSSSGALRCVRFSAVNTKKEATSTAVEAR